MARESINGISVPVPDTGEPPDFVGDLRQIATDLDGYARPSDKRVYVAQGITKPALGIVPTLSDAITEAGASQSVITLAPGVHSVASDLALPRNVSLQGSGRAVTTLSSGTDYYIKITGNAAAAWGPTISDLALDGVGIVGGDTITDFANGTTLVNLSIYNVDIGVTWRFNTWLTRVINCRIYNCATGIKHDFAPVAANSGANMVYTGTVVFDCSGPAFWQNGYATDGAHVTFTDCNFEHCATSFKLTGVGTCIFDAKGQHFEGNVESYVEADSGEFRLSHVWQFSLQAGAQVAHFVLSGTAAVWVDSGRIGWTSTSPLFRITDTARLWVDEERVLMTSVGLLAGSSPPGNPAAAGNTGGLRHRTGWTISKNFAATDAVLRASATILYSVGAACADDYDIEFSVTLSAAGAGNTLRVYVNPGTGGGILDFPFSATATRAVVSLRWTGTQVTGHAQFSDGLTTIASAALTHSTFAARYVQAQIVGAGSSTATVVYRRAQVA